MKNKFTIVFLTRVNDSVGLGHLNRCVILAKQFIQNKNKVTIYVYGKKTNISRYKFKWIKFIDKKNFELPFADLCIIDTYDFQKKFFLSFRKIYKNILLFVDNKKKRPPNWISGIINSNIY